MINENEIQISNKSYINKDFASIYPELLDLAKKMSRRWDPETSNESDPGIVLLKLLGFIGDKLNYNVDKNVLECFMPSCTQESSMRKLCDMLGYEMGYYIAPEAQVTFSYSGDEDKWPEGVTFPALSTSVSDDGESVFYVLTEGLSMPVKGDREPRSAPAIQGTVSTLSAGDSPMIGLENLDDNNRVYFPVTGVAQNGVFVSNVNTDGTVPTSGFWRRSVNLNVEQVGSKVFKFGYNSSRGLPYIEFPDDIASLIGDGLSIRYVVTNGVSGAVSAGMLTRLSSPKEATVGEKTYSFVTDPDEASSDSPVNLVVNNPSASTPGANPETIDEAYNSFKRRIGTFDTFVTCRDYANFIYNMELSGQPVVSNVQVSDRRDDINRSWRVVTLTPNGQATVNANIENPSFGLDGNALDANTLCLYLFQPYVSNTEAGFAASFRSQGTTPRQEIVQEVESSATASHDYAGYGNATSIRRTNDIAAVKNYMTLEAKLTTTYKVNAAEAADIETNVKRALVRDYNMREVDWGYEIPYESLLKTIQGADKRISSVSLAEPELTTRIAYVGPQTAEVPFMSYSDDNPGPYVAIMSKNILSGRLPLFDYDDSFEFDFGQSSDGGITKQARKVATAFVKSDGFSGDYTLRANEVVQFLRPALSDVITYPAYVHYAYVSPGNTPIAADSDYELKEGEYLAVSYTDTEGRKQNKVYPSGTIVKPNFELKHAKEKADSDSEGEYIITVGNQDYVSDITEGSESIAIRRLNSFTLSKTPYYCYWLMDNADNELFDASDEKTDPDDSSTYFEKVLGDNEYFFYTDASFRSMATLGSGTTIRFVGFQSKKDWKAPSMDLTEALGGGLLSLRDKWQYFDFRSLPNNASITAQENEILTLVEGDSVSVSPISGEGKASLEISPNSFGGIDLQKVKVSYSMSDGTKGELATVSMGDDYAWQARTRLDLDLGPSSPQVLLDGHFVCVYPMDGDVDNMTPSASATVYAGVDAEGNVVEKLPDEVSKGFKEDKYVTSELSVKNVGKLMCNYLLQASGSWNIDLKAPIPSMAEVPDEVPDKDGTGKIVRYWQKFDYPVSFYGFDCKEGLIGDISRDENGFGVLDFSNDTEEGSDPNTYSFDLPQIGKECIVAFYWIPDANSSGALSLTVKGGTADGKVELYNISKESSGAANITLRDGLNNVRFMPVGVVYSSKVTLTLSNGSGRLVVARPRFYDGYNPALNLEAFGGLEGAVANALLEEIRGVSEYEVDGQPRSMFMYSASIANSDMLDVKDATSPYSFYEYNNVANKFTISEIDFESSDISVVRSSRLDASRGRGR